ncbi:hypothetical protein Hanom_Chr10g00907931 [Helianthus anomalus]
MDAPADPEMIPADPEPIPANPELVPAPESMPAPEPLPGHDPVPFGVPVVTPLIPDSIPAPADPAVFADQIDPRCAFTSNGWIESDVGVEPYQRNR